MNIGNHLRHNKLFSPKAIVFAVVFFVSAFFLVSARSAYPVPAGDSSFFLVPAVQFARNGTLVNPILPKEYLVANAIDTSETGKFLFYPPLFPLVVSFLMPYASVEGAFLAVSFINIVVLWCGALLFYKVAAGKADLGWSGAGIVTLAVFALAASLAETGRPETLARLWVVLGALVPFYISKKHDWILWGILLGFLFATHPAAGAISFFVFGLMFGVFFPAGKTIVKMSGILLVSFFTALGVIALGPFGIRETIGGTLANAATVAHIAAREGAELFTAPNALNSFLFLPTAPFYGLVVLLLFGAGAFFFRKYRAHIVSPIVTAVSATTLVYIAGKIIYTIGHMYYFAVFASIIFSVFIYLFLETKKIGKSATVLVLALVASGFAHSLLLFPFFAQRGQDLRGARDNLAEIIQPYETSGARFGIGGISSRDSWYFFDDYKNMYPYSWPDKPKEKTALIFFQQWRSGLLRPPEIPGCAVKKSTFSKEIPKLFGVKLANTMPGYGYAVYECAPENKATPL